MWIARCDRFVKGTTTGVTTDHKGYYSIFVPQQEKAVLVFSFMGMKQQEIRYTGEMEVTM